MMCTTVRVTQEPYHQGINKEMIYKPLVFLFTCRKQKLTYNNLQQTLFTIRFHMDHPTISSLQKLDHIYFFADSAPC